MLILATKWITNLTSIIQGTIFGKMFKIILFVCALAAICCVAITEAKRNTFNWAGHLQDSAHSKPPFGSVKGTFTVKSFSYPGTGKTGTLVGTLQVTKCIGSATCHAINGKTFRNFHLPVSAASAGAGSNRRMLASCSILHLNLGPLDLNLLGLVVTLNELNLNVIAQSGAGELLGNLLCAVANLLNGTALLSNLLDLINGLLHL